MSQSMIHLRKKNSKIQSYKRAGLFLESYTTTTMQPTS